MKSERKVSGRGKMRVVNGVRVVEKVRGVVRARGEWKEKKKKKGVRLKGKVRRDERKLDSRGEQWLDVQFA